MTDLKAKTVLLTGGSRGIGAAIARAVGAAGGEVVVHYAHNKKAAEAVRQEIGRDRCHVVQADLAVPGEADRLWSEALAAAPRLNVLINNAGVFEDAPVEASDEAWRTAWSRVLQINLLAPADLCRAAIRHFRTIGGGRIVNVASRAAFRGEAPDQMPYGASKGALAAFLCADRVRHMTGATFDVNGASYVR
jgi:NAD(P)-dependent dehydrogenase (short-subunit alcohol dehydrogenase family)